MKTFSVSPVQVSALITAVLMACSVNANADTTIHQAINTIGVFGQGTGSSNEGRSAGFGLTAGATFSRFFTTATWRYSMNGAPASVTGTGGDLWTLDVDGGYLIPFSSRFQVGPYVGYNRMAHSRTYGPQSLQASDNALGGGVYAAWSPLHRLILLAHMGGYGAFGASAQIAGENLQAYNSNLIQCGAKVDYRISGPVHAFASFQYDDYTGRYGDGIYNGGFGVAVTY